jgi:fumarate reductase flavoprotein subunit
VEAGTQATLTPSRSERRGKAQPIRTAPFIAIPICVGITNTMGGVAVDVSARVLRIDGSPIVGLYAAGSTIGSLEGGPTAAYVGGLIKAVVFGLLAAESVATMVGTNVRGTR